jgi:hypothetical protein
MTMDPKEALRGALRALAADDFEGCRDYLNGYRAWRNGGGFEPLNGDFIEARIGELLRALMD